LLKVENISTGYGKKQVLWDVSFDVGDNKIVLLTGGNGSGKSTVLKCIYGLLKPWNTDANIKFNGIDLIGLKTSDLIKLGIVYIPQKNNYFEDFTVQENLEVSGSIYNKSVVKERIENVYKLPKLYEMRNINPFNMSGGERQLLALGNALIHQPKLILFDEPFSGLDKDISNIMLDEMLKLKEKKISLLIVEHKLIFEQYVDDKLKLKIGRF
jgi:branched-chain amino acid transport system ATP-binding protein